MSEAEKDWDAMCREVGHEWVEAGGGLEYCPVCQREKWADEAEPIPFEGEPVSEPVQ